MRVLQVITSLNTGGAEKLIIDSLPIYSEQEEEVHVDLLVLLENESIFYNELKKKFRGNVYFLSKGSVYNPLHIIRIFSYLKNYDLIHVHLFPTLYWVVLSRFFFFSKPPIVYTEHSTDNRRRKSIFFRVCDKWIYSKLDFIGCISKACYTNLIKHLDYKKDTIAVINNGIDLEPFNDKKYNNQVLNVKDGFNLIQISSFRIQKDQKTVIRSLRLLPKKITLTLVGDGPLRNECEDLVKELNLTNRVVFTGNRTDIPSLLYESDLAIQSSNYEGFGLVAVEAMAAGKAVVVSDVEGLRDVVGNFGVLFPKGNYQILAQEILKLYNDDTYRGKVEKKCKDRSKDFDIRNMVNEYVNIYKELNLSKNK